MGAAYIGYRAYKRRQRRKQRDTVLHPLRGYYDDLYRRFIDKGYKPAKAFKHADRYLPLYNQAYV